MQTLNKQVFDLRRSVRPKKQDIFDLLVQLPVETFRLFNELKRLRHSPSNITCMPFGDQTIYTSRMNTKRLKQLIDLDLVCYAKTVDPMMPIRKGSLMLNPYLLPTRGIDRKRVKAMWDTLNQKEKDDN